MPIMWRASCHRGDNPDPGIRCYIEKIVDEQRAMATRRRVVRGLHAYSDSRPPPNNLPNQIATACGNPSVFGCYV